MKYQVKAEIFESFPSFFRGVVIASNIDNERQSIPELESLLQEKIFQVREDSSIFYEHPSIQAWCNIYQQFGIKQSRKISPSIGTLVKRIKKGSDIAFISPLVAISNLISLSYLVPSGGIDMQTIVGNLVIGRAQGDEHYIPLGQDEATPPIPGEVIYYDDGNRNVLCRSWNSRAGKNSIITSATRSAVIDIDTLSTIVPVTKAKEATEHLALLIRKYCNGSTKVAYLSKESPEIDI